MSIISLENMIRMPAENKDKVRIILLILSLMSLASFDFFSEYNLFIWGKNNWVNISGIIPINTAIAEAAE